MGLILYTGFIIPVDYMLGWASWLRWLNPIAYGFESVMVNEFNGQEYPCSSFVPSGPSYENVSPEQRTCTAIGSMPGRDSVSGTDFMLSAYDYRWENRWRNYGIMVVLTIFLMLMHLVMSEVVASARSKGEVLVFRRSAMAKVKHRRNDEEAGKDAVAVNEKPSHAGSGQFDVVKQTSIFHWEDVCYDIQIKKETRRILDRVDGWIKPGTLTALMVGLQIFPIYRKPLIYCQGCVWCG